MNHRVDELDMKLDVVQQEMSTEIRSVTGRIAKLEGKIDTLMTLLERLVKDDSEEKKEG